MQGDHRSIENLYVCSEIIQPCTYCKTIRHTHPILQKAIDYAQKMERGFLLVKGIQQTEFDTAMTQ